MRGNAFGSVSGRVRRLLPVLVITGASTALGVVCYKNGPASRCCAAPSVPCSAVVDGQTIRWNCVGTTDHSYSVQTVIEVTPPDGQQTFTQHLQGSCTIKPKSCGASPNSCVAGTPYNVDCYDTKASGAACN